MLPAWVIDTEGRKHLLHLAVGNKESKDCWVEFFRHMVARGLRMPTSPPPVGAWVAGLYGEASWVTFEEWPVDRATMLSRLEAIS